LQSQHFNRYHVNALDIDQACLSTMMVMENADAEALQRENHMYGMEIAVSELDPMKIQSYVIGRLDTPSSLRSQHAECEKLLRFSNVVDVVPPNPLYFVENFRSDMWYTCKELMGFKSKAKNICRVLRASEEAVLNAEARSCSSSFSEATRGLEQRACAERQRRKFLTNKYIVREQYQQDPDQLAATAQRCNRWAAKLAQEEAYRDSVQAYLVLHEDKVVWDEKRLRIVHRENTCSKPLTVIDQNLYNPYMMNDLTISSSSRRVRRRVSNGSCSLDSEDASI